MRRFAFVVGLTVLAAVGCKHVAGRCDCTHHPDNAELPAVGQPYSQIGAPIGGTKTPEVLAAPDAAKK